MAVILIVVLGSRVAPRRPTDGGEPAARRGRKARGAIAPPHGHQREDRDLRFRTSSRAGRQISDRREAARRTHRVTVRSPASRTARELERCPPTTAAPSRQVTPATAAGRPSMRSRRTPGRPGPRRQLRAGSSPESLESTGTPQANASTTMRPNCSRHAGVVWLGAHRTSMALRCAGTSSCATPVTTRTSCPREGQARSMLSSGPAPTNKTRHGERSRSTTRVSNSSPFSGTKRPRYPTTGGPGALHPSRVRTSRRMSESRRNMRVSTPSVMTACDRSRYPGRSRRTSQAVVPAAIQPAARPSTYRSVQRNGGG